MKEIVIIKEVLNTIESLENEIKVQQEIILKMLSGPSDAHYSETPGPLSRNLVNILTRLSEIRHTHIESTLSIVRDLKEDVEHHINSIKEEETGILSEEEKLVAIDVESNGLMGEFLSIAFETRHNVYYLRLSNSTIKTMLDRKEIVPYVYENVLPYMNSHLNHIDEVDGEEIVRIFDPKRYFEKEFHNMYDMLEYFSHIWKHHIDREESTLMWHMGHTVDARIFEVMHRMGYIDNKYLPYSVIDISYPMQTNGYKADSINSACEAIAPDIYKTIEIDGSNAVFDARMIYAIGVVLHRKNISYRHNMTSGSVINSDKSMGLPKVKGYTEDEVREMFSKGVVYTVAKKEDK